MLKRRIAASVVYRSLAIMFLGVVVVGTTTMILMATSPLGQNALTGLDATFEAVSGFATVGVSSGVTAVSTPISKIALILSMFIGRVGPVSFGLSQARAPAARSFCRRAKLSWAKNSLQKGAGRAPFFAPAFWREKF